jgi:hypothetical protein
VDMTGDGKTSLRGGYGIYYGRVNGTVIINALINTGLTTGQAVSSIGAASNPVTPAGNPTAPIFPNILTTAPTGTAGVNYFRKGFQNPRIHQGDVIVEREVSQNTVLSATYLFSFGQNLPTFVDVNLNQPTSTGRINVIDGPFAGQTWIFPFYSGARPNPAFGNILEIRDSISTKYHALVLQANRRLTNGLQFQTSYTLSRAQDNGGAQSSATFTPGFGSLFDPNDAQAENGYSQFDRRRKLVASVVYNTQFKGGSHASRAILNGWTIAPIFNAFSGARFTGVTSGNGGNVFGTPTVSSINGTNGSLRFALAKNNAFKQPNIWYTDLRISRRFSLSERAKLEFLVEGFNIFNRTNVTSVNNLLYTIAATGTTVNATFNPSFGTSTGADGFFFRERQIQVAARFEF